MLQSKRSFTRAKGHTHIQVYCLSKRISLRDGRRRNKAGEKNGIIFYQPSQMIFIVHITSLTVDVPLFFFIIYLFLLCVNSAKILLKLLMALSGAQICCHALLFIGDICRPDPQETGLYQMSDTANYWQIILSESTRLPWWAKSPLMSAWSPLSPRPRDWRLSDSIKRSALLRTKLHAPHVTLALIMRSWTL